MSGRNKPIFYPAAVVVIAGLIGLCNIGCGSDEEATTPQAGGNGKPVAPIKPEDLPMPVIAEAADGGGITTVKEVTYVPSQRLPAVKGTAAYRPMEDNTVRFALNVWAGWAPIILANDGFKPKKVWKTQDGKEFKVELVLIDEPVTMRNAYAIGQMHIGWATLDMLPLFMESFVDSSGKPIDTRIMPRVYQQVDWSNGGDGIIVRENIKTVSDLRGKKIALAENSPSHYFLLNMLVRGGVQPHEVNMETVPDAFTAAAAFNTDKSFAAAVTWAPDIYNLEKVKGNRLLVTTLTANKLIADVWFARADFAKDHPDIIEGLVRGIFDGMEEMKKETNRQKCSELMAAGYGLPASEALEMMADAHSTNVAENYQFLMNDNNPTNFERVWNQAYYLYRHIGTIKHQRVPADQVVDFSIVDKLRKEEPYASQKDEYTVKFVPKTTRQLKVESDEILTNTVIIHFAPNDWNLDKTVDKTVDGKTVQQLYDPNVKNVLDEVANLAGTFGLARIIIAGHTDSSMKGRVPADLVKELSLNRANAVKQALVAKFDLDSNQFNVDGVGWDEPADSAAPTNQAKNRRVEVKIYAAEAE
jgi:ABC-type nitrate/sulfonate/bicarbonate transport system substrate-binding protein